MLRLPVCLRRSLRKGRLDIFQLGVGEKPEESRGGLSQERRGRSQSISSMTMNLRNSGRIKNRKILEIQRYKGLGEMDASQLWETTLNPKTRSLARIDISDTVEADEVTSLLMSSIVPPRREFIMNEAKYAKVDV